MTTATQGTVHLQRDARIARITLERPPLNVLNLPLLGELNRAVDEAIAGGCDFLVLRGAGPRGFSAGVEVADHKPERVGEMLDTFHGVFRRLWRADCFTIAAVHGHCLGGGCELATFCDVVIAEQSATFGQPEIKLGCFPPLALVTFPRLIGMRHALDLILTGRTISAQEAERIGLVTRVVPDGHLDAAVGKQLCELHAGPAAVVRMTRRALWRQSGFDFERALADAEALYMNELMKTADAQEGIRAFLEKRAPVWQGR